MEIASSSGSPNTPTLQGDFVNLRPLREEDSELTLRWRMSERASLLNLGSQTVEQQAKWIACRPAHEMNFIIETKDHRPLGMLSLINIDTSSRRAESARFLIGDTEAVKGTPAAVEAMKLLYELAFDELKLERIYGTVASENARMIKWQKYLGMKEEGRLRRHYFINGNYQDAICLGLLSDEYRAVSLPKMKVLITAATSKGPQSAKGGVGAC